MNVFSSFTMLWRYFKSKEALTVILWYTIIQGSLSLIPYTSIAIARDIVLRTMFCFYPVFGMVADVWCGRLKIIIIGTWITWVGAVSVAIYTASTEQLVTSALAITILWSMQLVGAGIFQANALQFGLDQLQDASSEQHSSFVYWYIWSQEISAELYQWVYAGATSITPNYTPLVMLLIVITLLSFMLCIIPWFKSQWDFKPPIMVSNPYTLIYQVLSFARKHKYPLNRSAFTYWEEQRPSRIDLGESKYGGPFSHEQIEDVKAIFRMAKLLLLLTGFFICRNGFDLINISFKYVSYSQRLTFQAIVTAVVLISLLLHELLIYPCFKARYPGTLIRTSIGTVLSLLVFTTLMLYDTLGHIANGVNDAGQYNNSLNPWLSLPTWLCETLAYLIYTISVLEFIVAQSPQSMRGLMIGIYYCISYGLAPAAARLLYLPFEGQIYSTSFRNDTAYLTLATAVGIVSVAAFIRAAHNYKYREREEIVSPHIFAEQYYDSVYNLLNI